MFKSILFKLGVLYLLMDTFIRRSFHLEKYIELVPVGITLKAGRHGINCSCVDETIYPYFWIYFGYGAILIVLSIALLIYYNSIRHSEAWEKINSK